jgi:nucleotide-binding universal stress UspA family protein
LLHVIEPIEYEDDEIRVFYQTLETKAWEKMKAMVESVDKDEVPIKQQILFGRRAACIVEYTATEQVDLVVLSSHKIGFDQPPKSWATLSYQMSILCPCPVLLLK